MRRTVAASYPSHSLPTGALSVLVHALFLALLVFGMEWQSRPPKPMQAELWAAMPPPSRIVQADPQPTPPLPETPPPVEPPRPEPESVKPPPPVPPAPAPVNKPDIVTERAKQAKELAAKKAEEELREIERKKDQQDAKLREIDRQQKEKEKREAAIKEKALKAQEQVQLSAQAQSQREQAEEKRLAQQQREADERSAYLQLMQRCKERINEMIKSHTIIPASVPSGAKATFRWEALPDGSLREGSLKVIESTGQSAYEDAVQRGIIASQPLLPKPECNGLKSEDRLMKLEFNAR
jgi:colicin import membrane protein